MAFDEIFEYIGGNGIYQIILFVILGFQPFYSGFQAMAMIFLGPDQDHWCEMEELETLPYEVQKQVAIPYDTENNEYSKCQYYNLDYNNYTIEDFCQWTTTPNVSVNTPYCNAWTYDPTQYVATVVSEYDLVCDRALLVGLLYSSYVLALLFAAFTSGILSDYFGRKKVLIAVLIGEIVFALLASFAPNYGVFFTFRFFTAFCVTCSTSCAFVIITEMVGPQYRVVTGTIFWCCYAVGFMVLPSIAYFVRDFRYLQLILVIIMIPGLTYIWLVPESTRWLVDNNKIDQALDVLQFIADVNNRYLPNDAEAIITAVTPSDKNDEEQRLLYKEQGKWTLLCSNATLRKTIAIVIPAWIGSSLVYFGLSFNIGDLAGNIYMNTFISGAVEIPANFLAWLLIYYIGRRRTQTLSLCLAGAFCLLCIPFLDENGSSVVTGLALGGKAFITVSYTTIFLFTAEMFPTPVRHISHGICNTCGSMAGMLAPFMGAPLLEVWLPLPMLIFGLIGIISGPLILLLPETSGMVLPDTMEQAEAMWQKPKIVPYNYEDADNIKTSKF